MKPDETTKVPVFSDHEADTVVNAMIGGLGREPTEAEYDLVMEWAKPVRLKNALLANVLDGALNITILGKHPCFRTNLFRR